MHYLFLGDDVSAKDKRIAEIKKKILGEELAFDYELLYGQKLETSNLKKALIALPALVSQRLVVLRTCDKLSAENQELILEFLKQKNDHVILILESDKTEQSLAFLKKLAAFGKPTYFTKETPPTVFDVTKAIAVRKIPEALKILDEVLKSGAHPVQIMGGLIWFWGRVKDRVTIEKFKKGLLELQTADLNIKRSRLKAEYALEILVVKLGSLLAF